MFSKTCNSKIIRNSQSTRKNCKLDKWKRIIETFRNCRSRKCLEIHFILKRILRRYQRTIWYWIHSSTWRNASLNQRNYKLENMILPSFTRYTHKSIWKSCLKSSKYIRFEVRQPLVYVRSLSFPQMHHPRNLGYIQER